MSKYAKLWDEIKYLIKAINDGKAGEYGKDMKFRFESDDKLSLGRIIELSMLTVVVMSVFEEVVNIIHNFF